jgi:serine/threonine-protein kinase
LPFPVRGLADAVRYHITETLPDPGDLNPTLPQQVVDIIGRALAKDPQDRFQSAAEMAEAVSAANARSDTSFEYTTPPIPMIFDTRCFGDGFDVRL